MDSKPDRTGYHPEWIKVNALWNLLQRERQLTRLYQYENSLTEPMLPPASHPGFSDAFCNLMINNAKYFPPKPQNVTASPINDEQISGNVTVRVYQPSDPTSCDKAVPLCLYAHGGGWVTGNLDTEDHFCRDICGRGDIVVVSVLYRKFPAVRFPQNTEDCVEGVLWSEAHKNATSLGVDPARFLIMGGSAGRGLAVSTTHFLIEFHPTVPPLAGLLPISSAHIHPEGCPKSYEHLFTAYTENAGPIPFVTDEMARGVFHLMDGEPPYDDVRNHWVPVAMGVEGVKGFPKTWLLNSGKECFRDDGRVLEALLKETGVPVKREVVEGMPHYYFAFPLAPDVIKHFRSRVNGGIKWCLGS
ncbi:hypothetical protein LTR95_007195 [Oleoguttula sp. CCFEE 5521]